MKKPVLIVGIALIFLVALWLSAAPVSAPTPATEPLAEQADVPVGGEFTLTDQNGKMVHASDFKGRVMLVFFGFTHCPDICPVTTATLSKTMDLLAAEADKVAPLFITVDPKRDTPEVLKTYLANFNPHLLGLTGSPEDIKNVADAYKAYYAKSESENAGEVPDEHADHDEHEEHDADHHPDAGDENYTIDHSGYIYMMGKNGKYIRHFAYNASEQELADAIREYLKK